MDLKNKAIINSLAERIALTYWYETNNKNTLALMKNSESTTLKK